MKKINAKLGLNRETLQLLDRPQAELARGGVVAPPTEEPDYC